jgi:hypothetical protein
MDMKNKEHLLYFFLQAKISLSQYDYKFMANLQTILQNTNKVTTNQVRLFDMLIEKYKKQLSKNGLHSNELKELPWKNMVVDSSLEYTSAKLSVIDDHIIINVPFNKKFIDYFRRIGNNPFVWDRENRHYEAKFSTIALKIADVQVKSHFPSVIYSDELEQLLAEIKKYDAPIWNPTLKVINGKPIIAAINEILYEKLEDIKINTDAETLFRLHRLGITIDPTIYENNSFKKFASNYVYETEITGIEQAIEWASQIGAKTLVVGRGIKTILNITGLGNLLEKYNMTYHREGELVSKDSVMLISASFVNRPNGYLGSRTAKIIVLKDSRAVNIK